jgi:large subunit ribosomal protein L45
MKFKTLRWKWVESLEEPVVKHIVTREMLNASTLYAQVTVRFHSKQVERFFIGHYFLNTYY